MLDRAPADVTSKDGVTRRVRFRGAGFVPASSRYGGWIALALVIALWQAAGRAGLVNPLFLPAPAAIVRAIYQLAISGALWQHLSASLLRIGVGWRGDVDHRLRRQRAKHIGIALRWRMPRDLRPAAPAGK